MSDKKLDPTHIQVYMRRLLEAAREPMIDIDSDLWKYIVDQEVLSVDKLFIAAEQAPEALKEEMENLVHRFSINMPIMCEEAIANAWKRRTPEYQPALVLVKYKLLCPECNAEVITHDVNQKYDTFPHSLGTHSCENCDARHQWLVLHDRSVVSVPLPPSEYSGLSLLRYYDLEKELWLVIRDTFYVREGVIDMDKVYRYEEGTCPTNYLRVEQIVADGDSDPHGVFMFVRGITFKEACEHFGGIARKQLLDCNNRYLEALFPETKHDPQTDVSFNFPDDRADVIRAMALSPQQKPQENN